MLKPLRRLYRLLRSKSRYPRVTIGGTEWNYHGPGIWQHVRAERLPAKPALIVDNTSPKARLTRILATPVNAPLAR